jgi:hypothetical protein
MKKLLLLLGVSLSLISCDVSDFKLGGAPGVPTGGSNSCNAGGFLIYTTNDCDDSSPRCVILTEEENQRFWTELLNDPASPCISIMSVDYKGNAVDGYIYAVPVGGDTPGSFSYGTKTICNKVLEPCPF